LGLALPSAEVFFVFEVVFFLAAGCEADVLDLPAVFFFGFVPAVVSLLLVFAEGFFFAAGFEADVFGFFTVAFLGFFLPLPALAFALALRRGFCWAAVPSAAGVPVEGSSFTSSIARTFATMAEILVVMRFSAGLQY
jgi:hypothetical protein